MSGAVKRVRTLVEGVINDPGLLPHMRDDLNEALALTFRRKCTRPPSPPKQKNLTEEQKQEVRDYAWRYPEISQSRIAVLFNTQAGRVSEALRNE